MSQEFQKQLETIINSALSIFQIIATFLIAFLVVLWLTLCVWTFRDIQSRTRDVIAQVFATMLVLFFNIPGVLLYVLVRPKESLVQSYERSLQEEYMLQDLEEREICPTCRVKTQPDFMFCFNCRTRLRRECPGCGSLIKLKWASCPFCGVPQKLRPRDTGAERVGLGAPRTQPPQPRSQTTPGTAIVTTADLDLATVAYHSADPVYSGAPATSPVPPAPYADGGQNYNYPNDEQVYTYREEHDYEAYKPKIDPARSPANGNGNGNGEANAALSNNEPSNQYEQPTARYQPPRQRRPRSDNPPPGPDNQ